MEPRVWLSKTAQLFWPPGSDQSGVGWAVTPSVGSERSVGGGFQAVNRPHPVWVFYSRLGWLGGQATGQRSHQCAAVVNSSCHMPLLTGHTDSSTSENQPRQPTPSSTRTTVIKYTRRHDSKQAGPSGPLRPYRDGPLSLPYRTVAENVACLRNFPRGFRLDDGRCAVGESVSKPNLALARVGREIGQLRFVLRSRVIALQVSGAKLLTCYVYCDGAATFLLTRLPAYLPV